MLKPCYHPAEKMFIVAPLFELRKNEGGELVSKLLGVSKMCFMGLSELKNVKGELSSL